MDNCTERNLGSAADYMPGLRAFYAWYYLTMWQMRLFYSIEDLLFYRKMPYREVGAGG
jgi:hypothetical protein